MTARSNPGSIWAGVLARVEPGSVLCLRAGRHPRDPHPCRRHQEVRPGDHPIRSSQGARCSSGSSPSTTPAISGSRDSGSPAGSRSRPRPATSRSSTTRSLGPAGIFLFGDASQGGATRRVLIADNLIHDIAYRVSQETHNGYGIKSIGDQSDVTVRGNTIKSVAADYIQTDVANGWKVEGNHFLGPSLAGPHPLEHQDLWQIYAGGTDLSFTDNVARGTGTSQSLLLQMTAAGDRYSNVRISNNLFDHDSIGYTCQIYQADGLEFPRQHDRRIALGLPFPGRTGLAAADRGTGLSATSSPRQMKAPMSASRAAPETGGIDYNVSSDTSAYRAAFRARLDTGLEERSQLSATGSPSRPATGCRVPGRARPLLRELGACARGAQLSACGRRSSLRRGPTSTVAAQVHIAAMNRKR